MNLAEALRLMASPVPADCVDPRARVSAARDRYAAARMVDASLVCGTPDEPVWDTAVNSFTLEPLLEHVHGLPFFTDIADVRDPVTSELGKVLWVKCQARKSATMTDKALLPRATEVLRYESLMERSDRGRCEPEHMRFLEKYRKRQARCLLFQRMMLCSLLGNYTHVQAQRVPSVEARRRLYARVLNPVWFQAAQHACPALYVWCKREFLMHMLETYPGLAASVGEAIHYAQMKPLIAEAMEVVRLYVYENMEHDWSSLGAFHPPKPERGHYSFCTCLQKQPRNNGGGQRAECRFSALKWAQELALLLKPFHQRMLKVAYRKPDAGLLSWIRGRRVRCPLPLLPRQLTPQEAEEQDRMTQRARELAEEEEDQDQLMDTLTQMFGPTTNAGSLQRFKDVAGSMVAKQDRRKHATWKDAVVTARVYTFLAPAQFDWLVQAVHRTGLTDLYDLVPFFAQCGVTNPRVLDFMQSFLRHYRSGVLSFKQRIHCMQALHASEPHAYNLLQITAELVHRAQMSHTRVVGQLSAETTRAQIEALQRRSLLALQTDDLQWRKSTKKHIASADALARKQPAVWGKMAQQLRELYDFFDRRIQEIAAAFHATPMIEDSMCHLYFCHVCHRIYSHYRNPRHPDRSFYRWGLKTAWLHHATDTMRCDANLVDFTGSCAKQPLVRVNLIGQRLLCDKKAFQICVECGDIFQVVTSQCVDAGKGLMCLHCSQKAREASLTDVIRPALEWVAKLDRTCVICVRPTTNNAKTTLLPFGLVICRRCRTPYLIFHARRVEPVVRTREDFQERLRSFWGEKRTLQHRRAARQGDRQMRLNRQRNRQRKH